MIYCFETSAVNQLHDDPDGPAIIQGLFGSGNEIRITALNVIEVIGTRDADRRISLLRLLSETARGVRPLAIPSDLLIAAARGYHQRQDKFDVSISAEQDGLWIAMQDPEAVQTEDRIEVLEWSSDRERTFLDSHRNGRPDFQRIFKDGAPRPRSASELIRNYNSNDDFLYEVVGPIYERVVGSPLPREELRQFLQLSPTVWALFLAAWAYSIFGRGIRIDRYSADFNAGMIDIANAAYLPLCDVFVTEDRNQRKALRAVSPLSEPRRPRILSYSAFRKRVLVL
jgi:hypothetical protein